MATNLFKLSGQLGLTSDTMLREVIQQNMANWVQKLECGGDIERQHHFKKRFMERLRTSVIAEDTAKANEQHYEVPTEFFLTYHGLVDKCAHCRVAVTGSLLRTHIFSGVNLNLRILLSVSLPVLMVLGKRLKYSGCLWPEGVTNLEQAEEASLESYCKMSRLEDGHTVMDLGCGWGSFGLYVCEKFPKCKVTCVSNSNTQRQLIEARARQRGFADRLQVITADANTFHTDKKYDRIVSIEMFEHMKNYQLLFKRVASWLKPAGYLFIQILCHKKHSYAFDVKPGSDTEWMAKHFFTGGTMPSADLFLYFQEDVSLVDSWVLNGLHYSKTLEAWLEKMDASNDQVSQILKKAYGAEWEQHRFNWRLFFIFCSEVFGFEGGNEWHVAQQLFKKNVKSAL